MTTEPRFLYPDPGGKVVDSRPCFNAAGTKVVFMREPDSGKPASLWTVDVTPDGSATPQRLFPRQDPASGTDATRPDWSWVSHKIAFSGTHAGKSGIFLLNEDGTNPRHVPMTNVAESRIHYPSWYPDGRHLAVTDYVRNMILKMDSHLDHHQEALTKPNCILTGMSSVNQQSDDLLCVAAQSPGQGGYDQEKNHVWVQLATGEPHNIQGSDHGFGRAPWWSPDGRFIAFESDYRVKQPDDPHKNRYAIYIYRRSTQSFAAVTPLKDGWQCTHAKFHPTRPNRIVIGASHVGRVGIAIVDFPASVTAPHSP